MHVYYRFGFEFTLTVPHMASWLNTATSLLAKNAIIELIEKASAGRVSV